MDQDHYNGFSEAYVILLRPLSSSIQGVQTKYKCYFFDYVLNNGFCFEYSKFYNKDNRIEAPVQSASVLFKL